MRRVLFAVGLVLIVSCGREKPAPEPARAARRPLHPTATVSPPSAAAVSRTRSTPKGCAADGSYEQALDCFRQRSHLRFTADGNRGELERPTPGAETLRLRIGSGPDRGDWAAATTRTGVVWKRDGAHVTNVPAGLEKLFQRMTLFPDPQKKEGAPRLAGSEGVDGQECNRYEFTDVNSGDRYTVWVSRSDGRIVRAKIGGMALTLME